MPNSVTMTLDLRAPAEEMRHLALAIDRSRLKDPTPCDGTDVGALLAHVLGLSVAFRDGARKVSGPTTSTAPGQIRPELPGDWRTTLPVRLDELVEAWRDPRAWEGEATVGGVTLPAPAMAYAANSELVLHGWDLAVATGQVLEVAADNLQAAWHLVSNTPDDPAARAGLFGPMVEVPADAPLLDRVLGGAGRRPQWPAG